MGGSTFTLAGDFPATDYQQWRALADAALKGAPFDKLIQRVRGLEIQPLYTGADGNNGAEGWPGRAPYIRALRPDRRPWSIQQTYRHPDTAALNRAIVADLTHGVSAVELRLDAACRAGRDLSVHAPHGDGVPITGLGDLQAALATAFWMTSQPWV